MIWNFLRASFRSFDNYVRFKIVVWRLKKRTRDYGGDW